MKKFLDRLMGTKPAASPMRDIEALVAPLATPAVHIVSTKSPSLSHFGGAPRLPSDVVWPVKNGVRLGFLARLSLNEIHHACSVPWLPNQGALLFFYDMRNQPWGFDPEDRGSCAVLHVPDLPEVTTETDDGPNGDELPFPHKNICFERIAVLPSGERGPVDALNLTSEESDEYDRIADARFREKPRHQIAGFPTPVQGDDMELECQLVTNGLYCGDPSGYKDPRVPALESGANDWRLLLQFDTDDDLDIMWGDAGTIYYWVREQDARADDFTNSWLVLQCC